MISHCLLCYTHCLLGLSWLQSNGTVYNGCFYCFSTSEYWKVASWEQKSVTITASQCKMSLFFLLKFPLKWGDKLMWKSWKRGILTSLDTQWRIFQLWRICLWSLIYPSIYLHVFSLYFWLQHFLLMQFIYSVCIVMHEAVHVGLGTVSWNSMHACFQSVDKYFSYVENVTEWFSIFCMSTLLVNFITRIKGCVLWICVFFHVLWRKCYVCMYKYVVDWLMQACPMSATWNKMQLFTNCMFT